LAVSFADAVGQLLVLLLASGRPFALKAFGGVGRAVAQTRALPVNLGRLVAVKLHSPMQVVRAALSVEHSPPLWLALAACCLKLARASSSSSVACRGIHCRLNCHRTMLVVLLACNLCNTALRLIPQTCLGSLSQKPGRLCFEWICRSPTLTKIPLKTVQELLETDKVRDKS